MIAGGKLLLYFASRGHPQGRRVSSITSLKGTILVADDNASIREPLTELLRLNCYRVIAVEDGEQAFKQACSQPVDLVLLDVMMPGPTGFSVCRAIKARPETRFLPRSPHHRALLRGGPHPGHRSGRGRFSAQAGEEGRVASARAFARAAEALHGRTGKRGDRAIHAGAQHRSERSLHRGPLRPALALHCFARRKNWLVTRRFQRSAAWRNRA